MKELYDLLNKKKLISFEKIFQFCFESPIEDVIETTTEALVSTHEHNQNKLLASPFNFSASISLSGGSYPCASPTCRIKNVSDLTQFATIYSTSITIYNPFDFVYFLISPEVKRFNFDEMAVRNDAFVGFMIAYEYRPLIEAGIIRFSKTINVVCDNCKKERDKQLKLMENKLYTLAKEQLFPLFKDTVRLEINKKNKFFHLAGMDALVGEDAFFHYKTFPKYLIDSKGKTITDIKKLRVNNPLVSRFFNDAINSLMFQKVGDIEQITKTYLTNSLFEEKLLENVGNVADKKVLSFFLDEVPVVQKLPYNRILEMRTKYFDEFESFQNAVSEIMKKAKNFSTQDEFNEFSKRQLGKNLKDLKKIQDEQRKKSLLTSFIHGSFLGASLVISLATNSQVSSILSVAQAVMACKETIANTEETQKALEKSPLYFYFRLSKYL